jgi:hypothetical protein
MKTRLLLFLLLAFCLNVKSDVITPKAYTRASVFASIVNLESYPNVVIIGVRMGMALTKLNNHFIVETDRYYGVQEFSPLKFYAVSKAYLEKMGPNSIDWETDTHVLKSNLEIDGDLFKEKEPIREIDMEYKIAGFDEHGLVLYKSQQKYLYSNKKKELVLKYEYNGDRTKLRQTIE